MPTWTAGVEALRLQHVPADRRRRDAQVGDVDAGRVQPGDHRALDHAAAPAPSRGSRRRARRASAPSRAPSRAATAVSGVRSTLTSPVTPSLPKSARRRPRLPDQALVDAARRSRPPCRGRSGRRGMMLDSRADRDLVADRGALVDRGRGRGCRSCGRRSRPRPARSGRCRCARRSRSAPSRARSRSVTPFESTVYGPIDASRAIRQ